MTDLVIIAVDPGSRCGWACSDGSAGVVDLTKPRPRTAEPTWHGLLGQRFEVWFDALLSRSNAGVLVLERQLSHRTAAHVLLGLRMIALVRARGRGLLVEEVWSSQWQPEARAAGWIKGDAADARAMLDWWTRHRLPLMEVRDA